MRTRPLAIAVASLLAALLRPAAATEETLVHGRAPRVEAPGHADLEAWTELLRPRTGDDHFFPRLRVEVGITSRLELDVAYVFRHDEHAHFLNEGEAVGVFDFDAWHLTLRGLLLAPAPGRPAVAAELELGRPRDLRVPFSVTGRLLAEQPVGTVAVVVNASAAARLGPSPVAWTAGFDLGVRLAVGSRLHLALETWAEVAGTATTVRTGIYLGPSCTVSLGRAWLAFGAGAGLDRGADAIFARWVLGVRL